MLSGSTSLRNMSQESQPYHESVAACFSSGTCGTGGLIPALPSLPQPKGTSSLGRSLLHSIASTKILARYHLPRSDQRLERRSTDLRRGSSSSRACFVRSSGTASLSRSGTEQAGTGTLKVDPRVSGLLSGAVDAAPDFLSLPPDSLPSPSPGPLFSPSIFPPSGYSPGPTFHHESPTAGLDLLASSFDHLDQHVEQQPLPPPTPTGFPLPPLLSHAPQPASDLVSESSSPSSRLSSRSGSGSSQHQTPNIGSPSFQSTLKFDAPRPLSRKYNTFPPSEPSPSSFGPSAIQSAAQSNLRESITGVEATSDDERLLELLWPGWPPHLPSPGFLMHVVEIYFTSVPMSHCMFSFCPLERLLPD